MLGQLADTRPRVGKQRGAATPRHEGASEGLFLVEDARRGMSWEAGASRCLGSLLAGLHVLRLWHGWILLTGVGTEQGAPSALSESGEQVREKAQPVPGFHTAINRVQPETGALPIPVQYSAF